MPLNRSLALDEFGTFWTIHAGPSEFLSRQTAFPNSPPLYSFIAWLGWQLGGKHEYALRLPSVIALGIAMVLLYRLADYLFGSRAALPSVIVFICTKPIILAATNARPYAFVILAIMASTLALVKWLDSGRLTWAAAYAVSAAFIAYLQYLTLPVLLAHAVFAALRIRNPTLLRTTPLRVKHLLLLASATIVLMLPAVPPLLTIFRGRHEHVFAPVPSILRPTFVLFPPYLLGGIAIGLVAGWLVGKRPSLRFAWTSVATLPIAMTLIPTLLAFAVSILTPMRIFVPRYVIGTFAGIALLSGWAIGNLQPRVTRAVVLACVMMTALLAFGNPGRFWPVHDPEDFRGAIQAINRTVGTKPVPVLLRSIWIELFASKMDYEKELPGWVTAPLLFYPVKGQVLPVSDPGDPSQRRYFEKVVAPAIEREGRFVLLGIENSDRVSPWIRERFADYTSRPLGDFGSISAILYERRPESVR